jgi:hypothetical protein
MRPITYSVYLGTRSIVAKNAIGVGKKDFRRSQVAGDLSARIIGSYDGMALSTCPEQSLVAVGP